MDILVGPIMRHCILVSQLKANDNLLHCGKVLHGA